jgi:hypothetical protein
MKGKERIKNETMIESVEPGYHFVVEEHYGCSKHCAMMPCSLQLTQRHYQTNMS